MSRTTRHRFRHWGISLLILSIAGLAHAAGFTPAPERLDAVEARFLLGRAGFGASPADVAAFAGLTRAQAVDRILAAESPGDGLTAVPPPAWTAEPLANRKRYQELNDAERKARRELEQRHIVELRGWWLQQMLATPSPLAERMTLFWHNHFVSSHQKVQIADLMFRQNQLFRRHALGNFGSLLHEASRDPAMLIYLDNAVNRKGAPNENFAREVMELFTLGEGQYGEQDIKEAARAFTGWSIDRDAGEFRWRPAIHDDGDKTVLGRTGKFDGDAVLDILLAQPACAEYIVGKLWREFVSPQPDPAEVARIARRFRDSHYEMKVALRELFLAAAFWDPMTRAQLVKSPVELMVGTLRQFDASVTDPLPLSFAAAQLGQNLFNPPNVKGWPGGEAWINSTTLLARKSVLERVFRAVEMGKPEIRFANASAKLAFNADVWLAQFGATADAVPDVRQRLAIQKAVLAMDPSIPVRSDLAGVAYLRALLMDPVYQLK